MPIEIEKKYRLTEERCRAIGQHLSDLNAEKLAIEFEVNTIYRNAALEQQGAVLRLRRIDDRAILTFKRRFTSTSPIKRQLEEETEVKDADAMARILDRLGFTPSLVYEKRRERWTYGESEIAIDELPFGWFVEIEGSEKDIERVEGAIGLSDAMAEEATYPALTRRHGSVVDGVIEARFEKGSS